MTKRNWRHVCIVPVGATGSPRHVTFSDRNWVRVMGPGVVVATPSALNRHRGLMERNHIDLLVPWALDSVCKFTAAMLQHRCLRRAGKTMWAAGFNLQTHILFVGAAPAAAYATHLRNMSSVTNTSCRLALQPKICRLPHVSIALPPPPPIICMRLPSMPPIPPPPLLRTPQ